LQSSVSLTARSSEYVLCSCILARTPARTRTSPGASHHRRLDSLLGGQNFIDRLLLPLLIAVSIARDDNSATGFEMPRFDARLASGVFSVSVRWQICSLRSSDWELHQQPEPGMISPSIPWSLDSATANCVLAARLRPKVAWMPGPMRVTQTNRRRIRRGTRRESAIPARFVRSVETFVMASCE